MAITESKLKTGTFTLGAVSFACQATNIAIVPNHSDSGDSLETLCGDSLSADTTRTDNLQVTAIQDFDDEDGFVGYSWTNDQTTVAFSWKPSATAPTYSGNVKVKAVKVGGDVAKRLTTDADWVCVGPVVVTYV